MSAISSAQNLEGSLRTDAILLWHTFVWECLSSGKAREALEGLICYPDASQRHQCHTTEDLSASPTAILRAQQALTASRDHSLSMALPMQSYIASDLLGLLSYLSSSRSLEAARIAFSANITALSSRFSKDSLAHELLHQSLARLLYSHATTIPLFKPAIIREALASSIALFPHNAIFLSLYAWNEARFRIDDRVRSIVNGVDLAPKSTSDQPDATEESVTPHLFAIFNELNRTTTSGSNNNTIRNTFERAVASRAGAHSAAIWKLYVQFEIDRGDQAKAKAAWWRAVRACPWVKALWMMAFEELRAAMGQDELIGVYEMMEEKELRLHVDLREVLEGSDHN